MPESNNSKISDNKIQKYETNFYGKKYDEFFDRFKTWEQIKSERYLC